MAREELTNSITFNLPSLVKPVFDAIDHLTLQLGEIEPQVIKNVEEVFDKALHKGTKKIPISSRVAFEQWLHEALRINSALLSLRFTSDESGRIAKAYRLWSERQSDEEDVKLEVFAEQAAYVFFVRLLLVRVLEDKYILRPRLASNGGFLDWSGYVSRHFQELEGVSILNDTYNSILARKAGQYYMHFFHQDVFDWFQPDDFIFVETLEFLCR
ncbi:MAG TPA: hypothetical protein DHW02_16610, partial [Ktedonobacter sp.]|nr:hypothetical protein [Ktedonobacter sp.]